MLRFDDSANESELRLALVECGRICYDRRLLTSNDGNLSVRLGEDHILITAAGASKGRLRLEDLIVIDLVSGMLRPGTQAVPSSETPMHREVYRQRSHVRAVIHAHPVFATALTVAGLPFPADMLPEAVVHLGHVPVTDYAQPSSPEDADAIRPLIGSHDAIILRNHGALTCGRDLEEALVHLERLEHVAEVFCRAQALGHVERMTPHALRRLEAARRALRSE